MSFPALPGRSIGLTELIAGGARPRVGVPPFAPEGWEASGGANLPTTPDTHPMKRGFAGFIDRALNPTNALGQFGQALLAASGGPLGGAMQLMMQQRQSAGAEDRKFADWQRQYDYEVAHPKERAPTGFAADLVMAGIDPNSEEGRKLARARVDSLIDPQVNISVPDVGTYFGPRSGIPGALGLARPALGAPEAAQPTVLGAELPPGWKVQGGGAGNGAGNFRGR